MTTVISVRFRSGSKTYYFDPKGLEIETGQDVIVETSQGAEFAQCCEGNHAVPDESVVAPLRPVLRIATENDRRTAAYHRGREKEAFDICQKKIQQHKLDMKLVRVECSFDGSKILFFFTADGRVDFRDLVKDLAGVFRSRIELRQIGVRDEAKMLGGLGICGRPFCCSQFMDEFIPVSIKMAKTQSLSLNPTKISGTCGRLMCCLKYEQDAYEDALKRLPKQDSFVVTPDGPGNVSDVNVLKETVDVKLDDRSETPRCYHNCEVCVLRNGKGSRDGIEIPADLPERYVQPAEEELPIPAIIADFDGMKTEDPSAAPEREGEKRRRRNHGHKGGRSKSNETAAAESSAARPGKAEPHKGGSAEPEKTHSRRRRGGRGGSNKDAGENAASKQPVPSKNPAPRQEPPAGETPKKKPRHRGGRRHHGGRGGSPASEEN